MPPTVAKAGWRLLVKSRQIARRGASEELLGGGAGEEAEVAHHVGLIGVAGGEGDLGEGFSGVPEAADVLEAGEAAERFGGCADGGAELPFERAEAHGGVAGDGSDGGAAVGAADHLCGGFDLRGDCVSCADAAGEEVFYGEDLLVYFARVGEGVLDIVDFLSGQDVFEGECSVVEKVCTIVEDGGGADLGKADDDHGGVGGVVYGAGLLLQAGYDGLGETLVVEGCGAGLAQDEGEGGFGEKKLYSGVVGADPEDLAHVAAEGG